MMETPTFIYSDSGSAAGVLQYVSRPLTRSLLPLKIQKCKGVIPAMSGDLVVLFIALGVQGSQIYRVKHITSDVLSRE